MSIGERIKQLRNKIGLTQKQLAEKLSLSLDMIKSLEQNRTNLSVDNLNKISDFFNCTTDYLLGRTDSPNLLIVETWDDFHDYMKMAAQIADMFDHELATRIRTSLSMYPTGDASIPAPKEKMITNVLRSTLDAIEEAKKKSKDPSI